MKTIVLIPIKNEDWILRSTFQNLSPHVDLIIVADQGSTDTTIEICREFTNVQVIQNPYQGHSNKVRWFLLEEARKHGNNNLIICIDADEIIAPKGIQKMQELARERKAVPGDVFKFKWIQLWKSVHTYRNDGAWKDSLKNIAFIDNIGINEYKKDFVINDHTSRVPDTNINSVVHIEHPLLHYLFLATKRNDMKQAWYRCTELIDGKRNAKRINNTYRVTMLSDGIKAYNMPQEWYEDIKLPEGLDTVQSNWHLNEIKNFFAKYGIGFFEDLQIWHIPELHQQFIEEKGREPKSKTYPGWLVFLNEIKNKIKNFK
jgi:glycosyltransferase involved in cell wall biosynthesis